MAKRKQDPEEVKPKKKMKRHLRKLFFLTVVGGGAVLARSEDLRSKVLDKLFGAEQEFNYSEPAGDAGATTPDA